MSYQQERDQFIARMAAEGLPLDTTRALLRAATTLQRLAEAQCNGDWPADNGERQVFPCGTCEQLWIPSSMRKIKGSGVTDAQGNSLVFSYQCKDCRTVERVKAAMPENWTIDTQGDPRGYVLRVIPPSFAERNAGRDRFNLDTVGVPCR